MGFNQDSSTGMNSLSGDKVKQVDDFKYLRAMTSFLHRIEVVLTGNIETVKNGSCRLVLLCTCLELFVATASLAVSRVPPEVG